VGALIALVALGGFEPAGASGSPRVDAGRALSLADAARDAGDLEEADRLYRLAWDDPRTRARAADALRGLERAGRSLPIDEPAVAQTAAILGAGFARFESDHFVVLSDAARGAVRAKIRALERTYDQFFRAMDRLGVAAAPPTHRLLCVLFQEHAMYRAFAAAHDGVDAGWVAGYYAGLSNRAVFYEDATGPAFADAHESLRRAEADLDDARAAADRARRDRDTETDRRVRAQIHRAQVRLAAERERLDRLAAGTSVAKTVHEAVHLLAFNTGVQSRQHEYPFWFTEGLATAFETDDADRAFGPGRSGSTRDAIVASNAQHGADLPLRVLVSRASAPDATAEQTEAAYAQAWSLFEFLHRTERAALAGFVGDVLAEPPGRMTDDRRLALFEARFGDAERVERRWRRSLEAQRGRLAGAPGSP